ncbi:hypothetical protein GUITHDRAFT_112874 [Guillardia theta CCMP2712]|uniref:Uncharacterized protein n=1 Tax=Guillardia theta (strain CCMP2712) TaxID=905079 RepID=L1IZ08_GUITC|nr:hypothetical protein GUITHDRAFT_112874 [Guillardia theta CCMP2712]EKX41139.1 hypothetical protein GUITHDRAFT_112874 [Guillardia theta CCMP2712]|eukprot:XP_005828119.1 hypothetical protein GUITHDRAFT_112874 [Guillardia theta CCMP2712]
MASGLPCAGCLLGALCWNALLLPLLFMLQGLDGILAQEPIELEVLQPGLGEKIKMISNEGTTLRFRSEGLRDRCEPAVLLVKATPTLMLVTGSAHWFVIEVNGAEVDRMTYCHCEDKFVCFINMYVFNLTPGNVSLVLKISDDKNEVSGRFDRTQGQRTECFCRYNFKDLHKHSLVCNSNSSCELKGNATMPSR